MISLRVQRACNGCGRDLRDATQAECEAAVDGRPLPDVRSECPDCRVEDLFAVWLGGRALTASLPDAASFDDLRAAFKAGWKAATISLTSPSNRP